METKSTESGCAGIETVTTAAAELRVKTLSFGQSDFEAVLEERLAYGEESDEQVNERVAAIIEAVKRRGDDAVLEYTERFDRFKVGSVSELEVTKVQMQRALNGLDDEVRTALEAAAERIEQYHKKQTQASWQYSDEMGNRLGQQVRALDRVGIYVPGGKASYPSSVLMNAIPAKVAGVEEIIMVAPAPDGDLNPMVLAAASIAGVDRIFKLGGAQAVAALAYGTETLPAVDKIVGPGNIYVATAKRMVFGKVGIDMIAGPSEILVVCDGQTPVDWIVKDLFSQAEHDEDAQSILISTDNVFLEAVQTEIAKLLEEQPRKEIIKASLERRGLMIHVDTLDQAVMLINAIAPEHLELSVEEPEVLLPKIRHAGAIFMGRYTAEALGDYCAGPNHVLPTSGTARFASPLGVYDFQKRSSIIHCSPQGAQTLGRTASVLAKGESLYAHAQSAEARLEGGARDNR